MSSPQARNCGNAQPRSQVKQTLGGKLKYIVATVLIAILVSCSNEANHQSLEFVWRTDDITASIVRDDQSLSIGQYLNLVHKLAPGEAGWQNKIINIPESWIVREILVSDGIVRLETENSGIFELGRENVGELMYEILDGGGDKPDNWLQDIWVRHAAVTS